MKKARETPVVNLALSAKILNDVVSLYNPGEDPGKVGLKQLGAGVFEPVCRPRNRLTVMIIGNHSAGKSSFINWYTGSEIQKTGVAVESTAFTLVTNTKKNCKHRGEDAVTYFPQLREVSKMDGVMEGLLVKGLDDKHCIDLGEGTDDEPRRIFKMIDFIDTPGLVDGSEQYGFKVDEAIWEMAKHVDRVLVFLDPHGQAKCDLTINVAKGLKKGGLKPKFFLTKVDTVDSIRDLCNVIAQISGTLVSKLDNPTGWNLPYFYIPTNDRTEANKDKKFIQALESEQNMIHSLCEDFIEGVDNKVVDNLQALRDDAKRIKAKTTEALELTTGKNSEAKALKMRKYMLTFACWFLLPVVAAILVALQYEEKMPKSVLNQSMFKAINDAIPNPFSVQIFAILMLTVLVAIVATFVLTSKTNKKISELIASQKKLCSLDATVLKENLVKLDEILAKREALNKEWLEDNLTDDAAMTNWKKS